MIRISITLPARAAPERLIQRAEARVHAHLAELAGTIRAAAARRVLEQRDADRPLPSRLARSIETVEEDGAILVAARAPHAMFVEFGTLRMAAEPFLAPAFDMSVEALRRELAQGGRS